MRPVRDYRRAANTVYALHYHFVFITKYRKPVLRGEVGTEVRDLIREICRLWARGYFVCTSGNVTDEVTAQYQAPRYRARGR
jgi:REP element-mobilizing transposase RayT